MHQYSNTHLRGGIVALTFSLALCGTTTVYADSPLSDTTISYQGHLTDGGQNVDSLTPFVFNLFDLETGGASIAGPIACDIDVQDGVFDALLDFGVSPYTSAQQLWLEVTVGGVPLSRQPLTRTPFSLATRGIDVAANGTVSAAAFVGNGSGLTGLPNPGLWTNNNPNIFYNSGNVGIGTNTPANLLHVKDATDFEFGGVGSASASADFVIASQSATMALVSRGNQGNRSSIELQTQNLEGELESNWQVARRNANNGNTFHLSFNDGSGTTEHFTLQPTGELGLGTTSPTETLDVVGNVKATSFIGDGSQLTGIAGGSSLWTENGSDIHYTGGNVGVGVSDPASRLTVFDGDLELQVADNLDEQAIVFRNSGNNAVFRIYRSPIGSNRADLRIAGGSADPASLTDYMVIDDSGAVGIGTNTPSQKLDVNGNAIVDTLIIRGGADLVEGFASSNADTLEPGTVVAIDPNNPGKLMRAVEAYDRKVAGVVSGAGGVSAGIKLAQDGVLDGELPVAMTGRVYVKCSTENGPIAPGDRLTTAALAGHAMKATDNNRCDGAVIGKAMSKLDEGTGLVLVLVNLQ